MTELRLLPLLSSATEIVHALGLGQYQVGRSHECDYPACVLELPVCSKPSFPVDGSSAEIDALVKDRLRRALSIYKLEQETIRELRPTHIITQTQCKVCAVSLDDVEQLVRDEVQSDAQVVALEPFALADVWRDIERVAHRCGQPQAGVALIESLQKRMGEIETQAHHSAKRPTVAAIEWLEPLMAAGNWVPELIAMAAGRNLFGVAGQHSPWMTWDELLEADPDIVIALPCGFDLQRTRSEMHWITARTGWRELRAVKAGRVFLCDGNQFMNRPGPRLVESLQIFAEIFHPSLFTPDLENLGWERFV
ncbi:MAG TPA: cobalamin-binding protein [Bryobacteraceae bacterium]|nr:cobalamin-binding protein [Bryobacteraceae bacterium]